MRAAGKRNREIATDLGISAKMGDIHRTHIKIKLAARTLAQIANIVNLVRLSIAQG
jgi:FixJ family two-component response regulator